jgi:hypothetical protein
MLQKIKNHLFVLLTAAMLFSPAAIGSPVLAATPTTGSTGGANCKGLNSPLSEGANTALTDNSTNTATTNGGVDCADSGVNDDSVKKLAAKITNTFSIIVGAASVIMIIYGGFRYVTSGGESGRVGAAKNALLYAIVGLAIVALAQLIVHFVLAQATTVNSGTTSTT